MLHRMRLFLIHLLLLFFLPAFIVFGQLNIDEIDSFQNLSSIVEIYDSKEVKIGDGIPSFSNHWKKGVFDGFSKGPIDNGNWYKISLISNTDTQKILYFDYSLVPILKLWVVSQNDTIFYSGGTESVNDYNNGYSYVIDFTKGVEKEIYFYMYGKGWPVHAALNLYDQETFEKESRTEFEITTYLRAIVFTLLAMGCLIGILTKQKVFHFYVCTILSGVLFAECELGVFINTFGIKYQYLNYFLRNFFNISFIISLLYFYNFFIPDKRLFTKTLRWFNPVMIIYTVISFFTLSFFTSEVVVYTNFLLLIGLSWVCFIICTFILFKYRNFVTI